MPVQGTLNMEFLLTLMYMYYKLYVFAGNVEPYLFIIHLFTYNCFITYIICQKQMRALKYSSRI